MNPDDLNRAFFDKVLLDKDSGDITVPAEKVKEIQAECVLADFIMLINKP